MNEKVKKILNIVVNVLTYVFFAICLFALALSITAKRDADGAVTVFGMQARIVVSDSMAKSDRTDVSEFEIKDIPVRSMVFIELVPEDEKEADAWYAKLVKGDVLTFRYLYVQQETITHRITHIEEKATGGYIIDLEGDNKASDANTLTQRIDTSLTDSPNYVVGKVVGQSFPLGLLLTALKSPVGIVCIVIVPSVIIAIFEVIRIVNAVNEDKKKKDRETQQKRDEEFEEMKRKLELLEQQANATSAQPDAAPQTEQPSMQEEQNDVQASEKGLE